MYGFVEEMLGLSFFFWLALMVLCGITRTYCEFTYYGSNWNIQWDNTIYISA